MNPTWHVLLNGYYRKSVAPIIYNICSKPTIIPYGTIKRQEVEELFLFRFGYYLDSDIGGHLIADLDRHFGFTEGFYGGIEHD